MKKVIVLALVLVLALAVAGCDNGAGSDGDLRLGKGIITTIGSSQDLTENNDGDMVGRAQVDSVIAAVMIDEDGKVVSVLIDTAQTRVMFNEDGEITSDLTAQYPTKKELGEDYNMIRASGIGREWDEQIEAIEEWMIGKTASEISDMPMDDDGYPTDVDLTTRATMRVDSYVAAVLKAIDDAQ